MLSRKRRGELHVVLDDEVAALAGLLRDGHALAGEAIFAAGLYGAALFDGDLLAVDGVDTPAESGEGLFEVEVDVADEVVVDTLEESVGFLATMLAL